MVIGSYVTWQHAFKYISYILSNETERKHGNIVICCVMYELTETREVWGSDCNGAVDVVLGCDAVWAHM
jgi:hypothetical protein